MVSATPGAYLDHFSAALREALKVSPVRIDDFPAFVLSLIDGLEIGRATLPAATEYMAFEFAVAYALKGHAPAMQPTLFGGEATSITHSLVRILSGAEAQTVRQLAVPSHQDGSTPRAASA